MAKNKDTLAFPVADSKGECLNGSEGLSKIEYAVIKILAGLAASSIERQGSEMVSISIEIVNEMFYQLDENTIPDKNRNIGDIDDQKTYGLRNDNCCQNPDNWIIDNVSFCGVCKQNI